MAYKEYPRDNNKYDFSKIKPCKIELLEEKKKVNGYKIPTDNGKIKYVYKEQAERAIAACKKVADYENTTRYKFWADVLKLFKK